MTEKVGVIGLGYVGLPLALALAKHFSDCRGFDNNTEKVVRLSQGDPFGIDVSVDELKASSLRFCSKIDQLKDCSTFIVAVPTPVDENHNPDLSLLEKASLQLAPLLKSGDLVVYESTVYPGVTEEVCAPILESESGLKVGHDFSLGYSPERINPGDKVNRLENIVKVVSADSSQALDRIDAIYSAVVKAGTYRAASIRVAEAAKVIENAQRDLNIAFINELSLIFNRIGLCTKDVLEAAGTKWNFLDFKPGLVGGHCIGVDPYYLTSLAQQIGYHPEVILAGRKINDGMGKFVAEQLVKQLVNAGFNVSTSRVGLLGLSFKENISDIRNSRVADIVTELKDFGLDPLVHDPLACAKQAKELYGINLVEWQSLNKLDALILAVAHDFYASKVSSEFVQKMNTKAVFMDVKSMFNPRDLPPNIVYWSL